MSFKKYIEQIKSQQHKTKPLIDQTREKASTQFDRGEAIKIAHKVNERYIPPVDFSTASNFAFFGSAKEYYTTAIDHIRNYYPYDGTTTDKQLWHYSSSFLENYIFDHEYPKTNGYVIFSSDGWGSSLVYASGYANPEDKEYILIEGNLQVGNLVNDNLQFGSNLSFGQTNGNCIEFFIKKSGWLSVISNQKEVVLDVWNSSSIADSVGRFTVELDQSTVYPILIQISSGSYLANSYVTTIESGSIVDNKWHNIALNINYGASNVSVESYLDGVYQGFNTLVGDAITAVT